jgi:hypothetical protein
VYVRNTSRYPDDDVLTLVRFRDGKRRYAPGMRERQELAPLCVTRDLECPPSSEFLITIRLGAAQRFPTELLHTKRAGPRRLSCWREGLVAIAAHEAKHIEQYRHGRPLSEVECERFEAEVLERAA